MGYIAFTVSEIGENQKSYFYGLKINIRPNNCFIEPSNKYSYQVWIQFAKWVSQKKIKMWTFADNDGCQVMAIPQRVKWTKKGVFRAHVGGQFGQRSCLVAAHFALY
jgi:hypothetical protein